ncbi:carboxypeptidase B-like [Amphiura filiformis]|uniref:carboxypeptidase B-like n=1 Tax=Amphiura filiformis TaxID=82378 RepID=UPI003B21F817
MFIVMWTIRGFLFAFCIILGVGERIRYDGYQVLRITPENENELRTLHNMQSSSLGEMIDFWKDPTFVNKPVDIMVSPDSKDYIIHSLMRGGVTKIVTFIKDVQAMIEPPKRRMVRSTEFDYYHFNTIESINRWVTDTATEYATVTEGSLGSSFEGRSIKYLKISQGGSKKAVVMQGGMHAREWLSPATVIYLAKKLGEGGPEATEMLDKFDFYIIPVLNVDGYAYTWTNNRMWRTTRSHYNFTYCIGVDPNRNFDIDWDDSKDVGGSSAIPCSDTYRGLEPFSEVEVAALRDFVISLGGGTNNKHGGNVAMYIDYHTYSQRWLFPFGYKTWDEQRTSRALPRKPGVGVGGNGVSGRNKDRVLLQGGAERAVKALKRVHGTFYDVGDLMTTIYPVTGDSCDYMYEVQNVKFAYGVEGRDQGDENGEGGYGFIAPPTEIQPSGEENWAALVALCKYVFQHI